MQSNDPFGEIIPDFGILTPIVGWISERLGAIVLLAIFMALMGCLYVASTYAPPPQVCRCTYL